MSANLKPKAPKTINDWLRQATVRLKAAGSGSPKLDAEIILSDACQKDRAWLIAHANDLLPAKGQTLSRIEMWCSRREKGEPLAYIRGLKEFYGRNFIVTPDVLIPRPESEALVGMALSCNLKAGDSILDVGTGSGCLGITLQLELSETPVTLIDISPKALAIAQKNAEELHANIQCNIQDLFTLDHKTALPGKPFKVIIANLPYVNKSWERSPETAFEPSLALFSGANGLWHNMNLLSAAHHLMTRSGYVLLETDPRQHEELEHYANKLGFELVARDGFAVLFSRTAIDYSAVLPGSRGRSVDRFHA